MSSDLRIRIDGGNAAFDEYPQAEYARILRKLATEIEDTAIEADGEARFYLYDINGNKVGRAYLNTWGE